MYRPAGILLALATVANAAPRAPAPACPPADITNAAPAILGGKLGFCLAPEDPCWAVDPATDSWVPVTRDPAPSVEVTAKGVRACAAGGKDCVEIPTAAYADGGTSGAVNSDRTLVAIASASAVDVYDLAKKKRLTTIKGWKSSMGPAAGMQGVQFLGDTLAVWQSETPVSSSARLFAPRTGKRIGSVGKPGTEVDGPAVLVDGTRWAFGGFQPKVYIVDAKSGALKKTITVGGPDDAGTHLLAGKLPDGRIAVFSEKSVLLDPVTGKSTPFVAPRCPK